MPVTTNHTITVTINGTDKSSSLIKDSVYVKLQQNSKANIAELKFKNYDPPERSEVLIVVDGATVFGGYVVRKSASLMGVKNSAVTIWSCECKDWAELLDIPKITAQFVGQSDKTIIQTLFDQYLLDVDENPIFDTNTNVTQLDSSVDISFTDVSMTDALNQLAKIVGASWFIKPDKKLSWYDKNIGTAASFGISSSPNDSTTFGFLNNSLSYEVDSSTIINRVNIIGGVTSNGEKIEDTSNTGDGTTKTFVLAEIPNSIAYVGWNDGIGNYTAYGSFIGYAPQDKLQSQGGNYLVVCDQNARTVSIEGSTGNAPANSTTVTIHYYKKEVVTSTYNNTESQNLFGIYPISIENKEFTSVEAAQALANNILEQNAFGKSTIKFDTTKYGLLPGQLVQVDVSELEVYSGWVNSLLLGEDGDYLLLENGDYILLESYASGRTFIVQEVSLQPVVTNTNEFMLVCQVTAGKYIPNIVDALSQVSELRSSQSINANNAIPTRLSNISSDLGEVQIGRAVFTDGGTARYQWGTPNYASGVVIGLEDRTALQGAMYIYDAGSVKVKLGYLADMPALGTVSPSGWGIYTENGFFKGVVYASQLIGGTVTGSVVQGNVITGGTITGALISGGTIQSGTLFSNSMIGGTIEAGVINTSTLTGNTLTANSITSGTITGNIINGGTITGTRITGGSIVGNTIIGGTIATGTPPINSSNPGVYIDSTGLYGYGSAGLTFRLSSDPAIKPYLSSGTIQEVTYEVTTNSVIRTGTTNPRVQIDNSGVFGYDSAGNLRFAFDTGTGYLQATNGQFSGTVSASKFTGGTVEAGTITGNYISGGTLSAPTISGALISAGAIVGNSIDGNTITGNTITGGTVTGALVSGGTLTGALITGGTVLGGNGTVSLNPLGIDFTLASGTAFYNPTAIKWSRSGTVAASISGRYDGTNDYIWSEAGISGTKNGEVRQYTWGTASNSNFYTIQKDSGISFWETKAGSIQLVMNWNHNDIQVYKSLLPYPTYENPSLGSAGIGWRYLYMKDSSGGIWRIEVNTSGSIVITSAP